MPGLFGTLFTVMAVCLPIYLVLRLVARRAARKKERAAASLPRELLMAAFILFMAGLLVLVLQPGSLGAVDAYERLRHGIGVNFVPGATIGGFVRGGFGGAFNINIIGNIVMFVPLGLCLPLLWPRWRPLWKMALVAVGFPVCIEIAQLFLGRSTDIDDVILNAAGVLLGWALCRLLVWLRGVVRGEPLGGKGGAGVSRRVRCKGTSEG